MTRGRGRRYHLNLGLSVLNGQFHCNPQTLPITSCLGDVITNLFWRQTQGADLGDQSRCGTKFPISAPQVYDFDLVGVELRQHGGGAIQEHFGTITGVNILVMLIPLRFTSANFLRGNVTWCKRPVTIWQKCPDIDEFLGSAAKKSSKIQLYVDMCMEEVVGEQIQNKVCGGGFKPAKNSALVGETVQFPAFLGISALAARMGKTEAFMAGKAECNLCAVALPKEKEGASRAYYAEHFHSISLDA
eukprot:bmy_04212T0